MKKMLLGICYLVISQWLTAQSIKGTVTDSKTGAAVAAATVELSNIATIVTDEKGGFAFPKLKPGDYVLHISSVGYQPVEQTVHPGDNTIAITLQQLNLFLQPVEIKAIRAGDKAPFTKTDLTKKQIEKLNLGQDLPFILNQTPSTVVNSDAGNGVGYTAIRIRGSDAGRINVTLNGIPYNDAESQGSYFVDLPDFTSSVNSIQVQRGIGTSSNGAGSFGATINLSTNETNTEAYGEINNSYGSFNTWKNTVKAGSGLIGDHFTIDARLSKVSSDGFIDRASSDLKSFYVSGAYLASKTSIRLNVFSGTEKTYQAWNGIPEAKLRNDLTGLQEHYNNNLGSLYYTSADSANLFTSAPRKYNYFTYPNQTDNYVQSHYQFFINQSFNPHLEANTAFFLSRGKGYYEEYKPQAAYANYGLQDYIAGKDTIRETDLVRQLWLDNYYYGQILSLQYKKDNDQLTVGGGWTRYDGKHYGYITWSAMGGIPKDDRWYYHTAYKTDVNGYAKYQRTLSPGLNAFADLQYHRILYNIDGFRDNPDIHIHTVYNFFNPKLGLSYTKGNYQWYASWSVGNHEPNRDDFEAGVTQQPKPEQLHDFELGIEKKNSQYSWGATLYYMLYKNQLVLTGSINDVGSYTRTNVKNSYRAGIELQGSAFITSWLNATGNLTLSQNRIKGFVEYYDDYDNGGQKAVPHGTTDIALSPALTGAATINIYPSKNWEISLPGKYVSRQYLDNTSNRQRSLNSYYVQDVRAGYTMHKIIGKEVVIMLQVNNVFNKKYEPNGYTYSYQYGSLITENFYFPMAGTNYMLALNLKL